MYLKDPFFLVLFPKRRVQELQTIEVCWGLAEKSEIKAKVFNKLGKLLKQHTGVPALRRGQGIAQAKPG